MKKSELRKLIREELLEGYNAKRSSALDKLEGIIWVVKKSFVNSKSTDKFDILSKKFLKDVTNIADKDE